MSNKMEHCLQTAIIVNNCLATLPTGDFLKKAQSHYNNTWTIYYSTPSVAPGRSWTAYRRGWRTSYPTPSPDQHPAGRTTVTQSQSRSGGVVFCTSILSNYSRYCLPSQLTSWLDEWSPSATAVSTPGTMTPFIHTQTVISWYI